MSSGNNEDLSNLSMVELFRMDAESQTAILADGLLAVERNPCDKACLAELMRAAHSLKGAARLAEIDPIVEIAHTLEDALVAAQSGTCELTPAHVDVMLRGVDLINRFATNADDSGEVQQDPELQVDKDVFLETLASVMRGEKLSNDKTENPRVQESKPDTQPVAQRTEPVPPEINRANPVPVPAPLPTPAHGIRAQTGSGANAAVRVTAGHLNNLLALAGESLVTSRWVTTLVEKFAHLKRAHDEMTKMLDAAREISVIEGAQRTTISLHAVAAQSAAMYDELIRAQRDMDSFDRRSLRVSNRMYEEVLAARMRPFSDGVQGLPRMVRDLARSLNKKVLFGIEGETTPVDRDILQRLEAPLLHLIRNLVDHGIETPEERIAAGKDEEGLGVLQARHSAGMLIVVVSDDGRGIDAEAIRNKVVRRNLTSPEVAARLSNQELLEFLFLPGFSTKESVTEISGRGVGLDAVQAMVREVGGNVEISSQAGHGMRVQLQLPLTLSVVRALIFNVGDDPYAIPLSRVVRVIKIPRDAVQSVEGREHFLYEDRIIGLVGARQIFNTGGRIATQEDDLSVVVVGDKLTQYGLVVDELRGERELVVRPLDARLGKIASVSAAAVLPDGTPVLILDVDDLLRSVEVVVSGGRLLSLNVHETPGKVKQRRRVLVVDDSITVRETERKLLESAGYEVDVAVDGMDGWNVVRSGHYDLVVTDVDMPRMNGIELTTLIRKDHKLKTLPVMIVSYKDREEDRLRGLDAGADYYLTKASFHDDTLLRAAADLIGEPVT